MPAERESRALLAALREPPTVDAAAVARVKEAVRAESRAARRGARNPFAWFTRPVWVRLSPAQVVLGALLAGMTGAITFRLADSGPADLASAAGDPGLASVAAFDSRVHPVRFVFVDPGAASVSLAGDFNDWDLTTTPLQRLGNEGMWSVVVPLKEGHYTYSFVVDGATWRPDPAAPPAAAEDFGRPSSVLLVSTPR